MKHWQQNRNFLFVCMGSLKNFPTIASLSDYDHKNYCIIQCKIVRFK